jgi:acyl carrier protein
MSVTIEEIGNIVGVQLGVRKVSGDDRIVEDLAAESADVVNIVAAVEDKYAITIDEEVVPDIVTVADLVEIVRNRM